MTTTFANQPRPRHPVAGRITRSCVVKPKNNTSLITEPDFQMVKLLGISNRVLEMTIRSGQADLAKKAVASSFKGAVEIMKSTKFIIRLKFLEGVELENAISIMEEICRWNRSVSKVTLMGIVNAVTSKGDKKWDPKVIFRFDVPDHGTSLIVFELTILFFRPHLACCG